MILRGTLGATGTSRPTGLADAPIFSAAGTSRPTGRADAPSFGATGTSRPTSRADAPTFSAAGTSRPTSRADAPTFGRAGRPAPPLTSFAWDPMTTQCTCAFSNASESQRNVHHAKSISASIRFQRGATCSPCVMELVETNAQRAAVPRPAHRGEARSKTDDRRE